MKEDLPAGQTIPGAPRRSASAAGEMFETLSGQNRYAVLSRVETAERAETRRRRIEQFVAMLARGETIYPQRRQPPR